MYYTNVDQPVIAHKLFSTGIKIIEFLKLALKPGMYKNTDHKEWLVYLLKAKENSLTVVDIGSHKRDYLFDVVKLAHHSKKVITLEAEPAIFVYLSKMKRWFSMKNIVIEKLSLPLKIEKLPSHAPLESRAFNMATVIDIKERRTKTAVKTSRPGLLDNYFFGSDIKPDVLKIKADGNELDILNNSIRTLEVCKPTILLECRETQRSRERLLATFKMLADLNYSGFFILDSMKIPLANFDFNIYQNELYGFYCNTFLFE